MKRSSLPLLVLTLSGAFFPMALQATEPAASTPTVVYAIPATRWELQLPGILYKPGGDAWLAMGALARHYRPHRALGLEGSYLPNDEEDFDLAIGNYAITHKWEMDWGNQVHPYFKVGTGLYTFNANGVYHDNTGIQNRDNKLSGGGLAETGLTFGWSRGLVFNVGYVVHAFYQPKLIETEGKFRTTHGAKFSLAYRW